MFELWLEQEPANWRTMTDALEKLDDLNELARNLRQTYIGDTENPFTDSLDWTCTGLIGPYKVNADMKPRLDYYYEGLRYWYWVKLSSVDFSINSLTLITRRYLY